MISIGDLKLIPTFRVFFLVDACFLVNKYLPNNNTVDQEKQNIIDCKKHWGIIHKYINTGSGTVYIPDLIIAETFKVLAKKYYLKNHSMFKSKDQYQRIKKKLENDLRQNIQQLKAANRKILYHDVHVDRDIIVGASRFFEIFFKKGDGKVSIPDLILLSTAKYFIDFFGVPKENIIIISSDKAIIKIAKYCSDIPNVFNPYYKKNVLNKLMEKKVIERRINAKLIDD